MMSMSVYLGESVCKPLWQSLDTVMFLLLELK